MLSRYKFFLPIILLVLIILAVLFRTYFLTSRIIVKSNTDDYNVLLTDENKLRSYLSDWNFFGNNTINFLTKEGVRNNPNKIDELQILFVRQEQIYGNLVSDTDKNQKISSYGVDIKGNTLILSIYLHQGYWKKTKPERVNLELSGMVVSYLYELSHFRPDISYDQLHKTKIEIYQQILKNKSELLKIEWLLK